MKMGQLGMEYLLNIKNCGAFISSLKLIPIAALKKDIKKSANWLVKVFESLDKNLDYSAKSVAHIENLFTEQLLDGMPNHGGLFVEGTGGKSFSVSSSFCEVNVRNTQAAKCVTDNVDPRGELKIKLVSANSPESYLACIPVKPCHPFRSFNTS